MKKLIIFVLLIVVALTSISCKNTADPVLPAPQPPTPNTPVTTVDPMLTKDKGVKSIDTSKYIVKDGATDYVLLISENRNSHAQNAAQEFASLYNQATNSTIAIVTDANFTYTQDSKVISIGNNKASEAVGLDTSNLTKKHDVKLQTIDQSIFVAGGSDEAIHYAVDDLLNVLFDYEYYGAECYFIEKSVRKINLPIFDYEYSPTFTYRYAWGSTINHNTEAMQELRVINWHHHYDRIVIKEVSHNCQEFIKEGLTDERRGIWLAPTNANLCYSARGNKDEFEIMTDYAAETVKRILTTEDPNVLTVTVSNYDGVPSCGCPECTKMANEYHSMTAAQILWCNRVMEKVVEWWNTEEGLPYKREEFQLGISTYMSTDTPPTFYNEQTGKYEGYNGIKLHKNVASKFAPIWYDFTHSIYDNKEYYDKFMGWNALGTIQLWGYDHNFQSYFEPYDTFDYYQEFIQFVASLENCDWFMLEGAATLATETGVWANLKTYLLAKLLWNKDADVKKLTENFFKNYYGPVADQMYDMYLQSRAYTSYLKSEVPEFPHYYSCNTKTTYVQFWPKNLLLKWKSEFNQMVEKLEYLKEEDPELYNEYYRRIAPEYASPLFLLLELYRDSLDSAVLEQVKAEFKYLMTTFWFTGERNSNVDDMLEGFGIE